MLETIITVGILDCIVAFFLGEPAKRMVRVTIATVGGLVVLAMFFIAQIIAFVTIIGFIDVVLSVGRLLWRILSGGR